MRSRALLSLLVVVGLFSKLACSQVSLRKIGELELQIQGISATVQPANPTIPKNTPAGVRIVVTTASGTLSSADVAKLLGGSIQVTGELSGPGLPGAIPLPVPAASGGTPIVDPLILPIPALTEAGDYALTNLKILVNNVATLDINPSTVPVKVIDQVLITSVETRPLTLDEIKAAGVVLDSDAFTGFQFTIGLATSSNVTTISFPAVFDRNGVPIPSPLIPPGPPVRDSVPVPTIQPVLLAFGDCANPSCAPAGGFKLPDGTPVQPRIPGVLVIPGDVGFLKQFFSAQLFVANGSPGGSALVVHDLSTTIHLPLAPDGITADAPLSLPPLKSGPQGTTKPVEGVGPDGVAGTSDDVNNLNPGDQGQAEFIVRGDKEGFSPISFDIQGTLDGLATGPITVKGTASGGVLVRNPFFDMTFAVPAIVRKGEQFKVYITVKNISQTTANELSVTLDSSRLSGATLIGDATHTIPTLAGGGATTFPYTFQSLITGKVVASYMHFDTTDGTTGELKFTLGVGERGIPLSPDTLVLPAAVDNLPQPVIDAAMRVLGEGWSIANAPAGTLPASVIRTTKTVVTQKALALAEAGLRMKLGETPEHALRDLLDDFYGGNPLDPGFDQLLRTTNGGQDFERAIGAALTQSLADQGMKAWQTDLSEKLSSGPDFIAFTLSSGSAAPPVAFNFIDGNGNGSQNLGSTAPFINNVPGFAQVPLGNGDISPILGLLTAPTAFPYTLQLTATGSGTLDLMVTMPHADGTFVQGQISGVQVSPTFKARLVMDISRPDHLVLETDTNNDGTFITQTFLSTSPVARFGPKLISANTIGPETLPGATPLGVQMALLFDRVVDSTTAQQTGNYQIPFNAVQQAKPQLSGRIVVANLQQPEGPYVPTSVGVSGIADSRGTIGPSGSQLLGTQITDPGAVVSGRVFNADGTAVTTAVVTYSQIPPEPTCDEETGPPVGVSAIPVTSDGRYEVRYVRQDQCGAQFGMSTQDPNTGALRQSTGRVDFAGQHIEMDIVILGEGSVTGTVRDATGQPAPGAVVAVLSGTDAQIGARAVTDGNGQYSVTGITVGPVSVQAGNGTKLGHSAGNIPRAGGTAVIDVTLDGGATNVSGTLYRQDPGSNPVAVPNWPVVYSLNDHPGVAPPTPVAVVKTDGAGNFAFTGVPEGNYVLSAQLTSRDSNSINGVARANDNITNQNIVVPISALGTVNGMVMLPDKTPAAGVVISGGGSGVMTAADGTYSIPMPVQASTQVISAVTRDELRSGQASVLVTQAGQVVDGVNITLSGLGTAVFTVLDANGKPVANQPVLLACQAACGCNPAKVTQTDAGVTVSFDPALTDSNGVVTFTGMPVGTVSVKAMTPAGDLAEGSAVIPGDQKTVFGPPLRFHGFGTVTGTVRDPDNNPSFGANLALTANVLDPLSCTLAPGLAQQIQTDQSGSFKFTGVHVGPVGVTASQVFFPALVGAKDVLTNGGTVNFDLKLLNTTAGEFSGTVFLPDGVTPGGAGIEVTASGALPDVTVSTDTKGHFQFAKIFPQGGYTVTVRDPVTGGVARDVVFLPAGQNGNPAPDITHDFRLKGRGTVNVQVVDGSQHPVDNAFVALTENSFPNNKQEDTTPPGSQGTVTFEQVFEGPFSVQASDIEGRGGRTSGVLPGPGASVSVVVQLTSVGTVQGHFLMPDANKTPIPFGSVSLTSNGRQIGQVTTDGSTDLGAFTFNFVPAGPVLLEAQDPVTGRVGIAAGNITADGQTLALDVVAEGLGTVSGLVTSNGVNQAAANVEIFSGSYHASTSTDSTGRYVVSGVPVGHVVVNASLPNGVLLGTNSATFSADGAQVEIDVALRGSGGIQGQVVQADGITPAPGSLVTISVGGPGGGTQSVSTDLSGQFTFSLVPEGIATLTAKALSSIDEGQAVVDVSAGSKLQGVKVPLNGVGSITGHTVDSSGNPVAGHLIITGTGAFPYTFAFDTGSDGFFSLPQVLAGNFTASLTSGILSGTAFDKVTPNANTDRNVQLQDTGSVSGTVVRSDGNTPAAGANVTISLGPGRSVVVQAQTDGTFTATGVPLGTFTVSINDPVSTGQALIQGQSITSNGQAVDLDLLFPPNDKIVLNDTPMSVVSISPADGSSGIKSAQSVVVTFSNPVQSASGIQISSTHGSVGLAGSVSSDGKVVTFAGGLPASDQITVVASTAVTDTLGRHPVQPASSTFATGPPHVIAGTVSPLDGAIEVPASAPIIINFSEPLAATTNVETLITLNGPSGPVAGTPSLASPTQAVFTPAAALPDNSAFTVSVNGATDLGDNVQTVPFNSTFATHDTMPPVVQLVLPSDGQIINQSRPEIKFNATDNLSGVNVSTATVTLDGQVAATGTLDFTTTATLADGRHTTSAAVADRAGNVGTGSGSFTVDTQPPSAAQITSLTSNQVLIGTVQLAATATDAGSGVDHIDVLVDNQFLVRLLPPSFQTSFNTISISDGPHTFSAHAVDVAGNTGLDGDRVPVIVNNRQLTIAFTSPAAPNTFFRDTVTVRALPSEPVQNVQFTLGSQTVTVTALPYLATFSLASVPDGQQIVTANAAGYAGETASATIAINVKQTPPPAPNAALINAEPPNNGLSLVHGSSTSVEAGDQVQITNTNSNRLFTTNAAADGSFSTNIAAVAGDVLSIVSVDVVGNASPATTVVVRHIASLPPVSSVQPADGSTAVPTNSVVVVRFASVVQPASVVSGTVTLSQGGTSVSGSVSLSNDQLSVTFTPSQALAGLTTYTVKVQDAASGGTTVLFQSSFTTAQAKDTTPPTVLRSSPDLNATGVPLNAPYVVQFSKPMNPATFNTNSFAVRDNGPSQFLAGSIQVDATGTIASFVPQVPLNAGHSFTVFLSSALTDTAGNSLSTGSRGFTSAFSADNVRPHLSQVSPPDQTTGVPTNAVIDLNFSEPVDAAQAGNAIQVSTGSQIVPGVLAFSNGNQRLTFTPSASLAANTLFVVTVSSMIVDVAGNSLDNPGTFSFQTSAGTDAVRPSVVLFDPAGNATGVETNTLIRVQFSERIDPVSVTNGTIQVRPNNTGIAIPGTVTASADGLSATFVSGGLLPSTSYHVAVLTNGITDLAGNGIVGNSIDFITGQVSDGDTPAGVIAVSPQNGATGMPLNTHISVQFSEAMSSVSMESNPVVVTGPGGVVAGTLVISGDHTTMTLAPVSALAANSSYTVTVSGVQDVSGNVAPAFSSTFTTGTGSLTTRPSVSFSPVSGALNVPVSTQVTMTFTAPVDATTVNSVNVPVRINNSILINGSYAVSNSANSGVVTFTPGAPLPASTSITATVNNGAVLDTAGNGVFGNSSSFTTGTQ